MFWRGKRTRLRDGRGTLTCDSLHIGPLPFADYPAENHRSALADGILSPQTGAIA